MLQWRKDHGYDLPGWKGRAEEMHRLMQAEEEGAEVKAGTRAAPPTSTYVHTALFSLRSDLSPPCREPMMSAILT